MHLPPAQWSAELSRSKSSVLRRAPRPVLMLLTLAALLISAIGPNQVMAQTVLPPTFSTPHGVITAAFNLTLTSPSGGTIYYTLNGSTPSASSTKYTSPIAINKTTVVRAIAAVGSVNSTVATQTYIFLSSVRGQTQTPPAGWPSRFAADDTKGGFSYYPSDYEVDPDVVKAYGNATFDNAMKSLPSMSIVTDLPNLWDSKYGIYWNSNSKAGIDTDPYKGPGVTGKWERPISLEWIDPNGISAGFSANGGLRINGQASRRPYRTPKKSFRVYFKGLDYGTDKLDFQLFDYADAVSKFDRIIIRNGGNRNWSYFDRDQRRETDYVNDEWARRAWLQMGNLAPHGTYVHLYINGLYWGLYNVTERVDAKFVQAYMGGSDLDYSTVEADEDYDDVATADPPATISAWTELLNAVAGNQPITNAQYDDIKTRVDVANLADYFIHVHYIGKTDWPHHNWNAFRDIRQDLPGKDYDNRFKFIPWDNDSGLNKVTENTTLFQDASGPDDAPSRIFLRLTTNPEFRQVLADRLFKHVQDPKGALTPASCAAIYSQLTNIVDQAVIGESARWGDYIRDTYPTTNTTTLPKTFPAYLHSRDLPRSVTDPSGTYSETMKTWVNVRDEKLSNYCPQRSNVLVGQYVTNGWYQTTLKPPAFSQPGGDVPANYTLKVDNTPNNGTGNIYYTTDGTDPRLEYGAIAPTAINGADLVNLPITQVTKVRARVLNGTLWSPLAEYTFYPPQQFENLVISEIHYSPIAPTSPVGENPDDYEFVELHNRGTTPLRLDNAYFARGLTYRFPENTTIWPGQYLVLASKDGKFTTRYGFAPRGNYRGNLSNLGEGIELNQATGAQIDFVDYLPTAPWPTGANGGGGSLCLMDVASNNSLPASWKASVTGGTPGAAGCDSAVAAKPAVWFGPASLNFGEQPVDQPSLPQVATLANAGATPLTIASIAASGDFAQTSTCPATLAAGASCVLNVTFTPRTSATRAGTVTVNSNAPGTPHALNLEGIGVGGFRAITLSQSSLSFPAQLVGTASAAQQVTLTNAGSLAVGSISIAASDDFTQTSDCPAMLAPGASCTINVVFTPTAAETRNGNLTVTSNAPNTPHTVALTGVGTGGAPALTVSAQSVDFGSQRVGETSAVKEVTISNGGSATLNISSIVASGTGFAQTSTCSGSLLPGTSCTVAITFTPEAAGLQSGALTITSDALGSPHTVTLTGRGGLTTESSFVLYLPTISH